METIDAFPLCWPNHFERSKVKTYSNFKCTLAQARDGILRELDLLGAKSIIISSNIPLKKDGQMYAGQKPIDNDHGVAVYFVWDKEQRVLACDAYFNIWENLRAIERSIDAMRGLGRWKVSNMLKAAFTGFKALDSGTQTAEFSWWEILGVEMQADPHEIKRAYRDAVKRYHPDNLVTGDVLKFRAVKQAFDQAESLNRV
jgi:hypothetical protein